MCPYLVHKNILFQSHLLCQLTDCVHNMHFVNLLIQLIQKAFGLLYDLAFSSANPLISVHTSNQLVFMDRRDENLKSLKLEIRISQMFPRPGVQRDYSEGGKEFVVERI